MTYRELTRKLEALRCFYRRQGQGSHELWQNRSNGRITSIPRHRNRDLRTETPHRIRMDLGISREDFDEA